MKIPAPGQRQAVAMRDHLAPTLEVIAVRAHQKGLELAFDVDPEVPDALVGDPGRLRQVLVNLLGNAINFTERGEVVPRVSTESSGEQDLGLHFRASDTGIGIPKEMQSYVYEAFAQPGSSTTRRYGGTGLGMTISAQLVSLLGGRVWVESEPGRVSAFHFTASFTSSTDAAALPAPVRTDRLRGIHVLVVDDHPTNRQILTETLSKWPMELEASDGGEAALELLRRRRKETRPSSLAILDVQMPAMDGFEATALIRAREAATGQHLPIIALTAHAMQGDRERCLDAGMDDYVSKPIRADEMFAAIERLVPLTDPTVEPYEGQPAALGAASSIDGASLLDRADNDRELVGEIVKLFIDHSPRMLVELREELEPEDAKAVERAAHKIRRSLDTVAGTAAAEMARRLEELGRVGGLGKTEGIFSFLEREIRRMKPEPSALAQGVVS